MIDPRVATDREWMMRAACRGVADRRIFHPERYVHDRTDRRTHQCSPDCSLCRAVAVCGACPVRSDCRGYIRATEPNERLLRTGIWAGLTPSQRQKAWGTPRQRAVAS